MSFGGNVAKAKATPALPHEGISSDEQEEGIFNRMLGRVRRVTNARRGDYEMVEIEAEGDDG